MTSKSSEVRTVRLPCAAVQQVEAIAKQTQVPPATLLKGVVLSWLEDHAARTLGDQDVAGLSFATRN